MFEAKMFRQKDGRVSLTMKSAAMEAIIRGAAGGSSRAWTFNDCQTQTGDGPATPGTRIYSGDAVRLLGDACGLYYSDAAYYDGGLSMTALSIVGLEHGVTLTFSRPMTAAQVKTFGENVKRCVKALFDGVRSVDLTIKIAPDEAR